MTPVQTFKEERQEEVREEKKIKQTLQANIIRSNGRKYNLCLFVKFNGEKEAVRKYLNKLLLNEDGTCTITTAQKQDYLHKQSKEKNEKTSSNPEMISGFFLTYDGLSFFIEKEKQLDLAFLNKDFRGSFKRGIRKNIKFGKILKGNHWKSGIHAMILLADNDLCKLKKTHLFLKEKFSSLKFIKLIREEYGDRDEEGFFGFKEGRIKADIWDYSNGSLPVLDTEKLKKSFIFKDFENGKEEGWGSMFVFAKFQHRKAVFEDKIRMLKNDSSDREFAKAKILGKFYNGLPLEVSTNESDIELQVFKEKSKLFDRNLLTYSEGSGCPLGAHVRKMNPRNKEIDKFFKSEDPPLPYKRQLIRRGIGYSSPKKKARGLLFMSYQTSISNQFEKMLINWIETGFPATGASQDEVIASCYFRGGEYFYTPSIAFLKNVLLANDKKTEPQISI